MEHFLASIEPKLVLWIPNILQKHFLTKEIFEDIYFCETIFQCLISKLQN